MSYHFEELHPQQPPEDLQFHASTHTEIVRDAIDATHDAGSSVQLEDRVQCRRPRCLGLPVVRFVPRICSEPGFSGYFPTLTPPSGATFHQRTTHEQSFTYLP